MVPFVTDLVLLLFVKSTVILLVTWLITTLLRKHISANIRVSIWIVALISLVLMPVFNGALPSVTVKIPQAIVTPISQPEQFLTQRPSALPEKPTVEDTQPDDTDMAAQTPASVPESAAGTESVRSRLQEIVSGALLPVYVGVGLWILGVAGLIGRLSLGLVLLRRLSRTAESMENQIPEEVHSPLLEQIGLRRRVRIACTGKIQVPMVWGVLRPTVLLPENARSWDTQKLRVVLLHEFSHIRHGDFLIHVFAKMVCALYWMNPLIWFAAGHVRQEQEKACDNRVLNFGTVSFEYAEHLLDLVESLKTSRLHGITAAVAMSNRHDIKERIREVLDAGISRHPLTVQTALLVILLGTITLLPLALLQFEAARPYRFILLEAEDAELPVAMVTMQDVSASNGQYLRVADGYNSRDRPSAGGQIRYNFLVETAGEYVIWGRTQVASDGENSFWIRIDGGEWINWNGIRESGEWAWNEVFDSGQNGRSIIVSLPKGIHTLELAYREENIRLDKLLLTNHLTYRPTGKNPDRPSKNPFLVWLEAEDGWLERPMRMRRDIAASRWQFIEVEDDRESRDSPPSSGRASYRFQVRHSGVYRIWGRIFADDDEADSFWVRMDGGQWIRWNELLPHDRWGWAEVFDDTEEKVPIEFNLENGDHHLEIAYREDGARLDRLLITDDRNYYPRGYGQIQGDRKRMRSELQPERGRVTAPMQIGETGNSDGTTYIGVPSDREDEAGYADIDFTIPATDDYVILGRVQTAPGENSFYISLDGGEEVVWHLPVQNGRDTWWYPVSSRTDDPVEPVLYNLQKGTHTLRIRNREAGTRIDRLVVCNWADFVGMSTPAEGIAALEGF